jgi:hypothetical protein
MKRMVSALALAGALVLAISNTALAASPSPVRISRGDPFANCLLGGNGTALNYRSAEIEPWIAANPARPGNLIGTWQQDRWSNGGAKGQTAGFTFDGGRTWGQVPQPFTKCAQPFYRTQVLQYERTSDPWVSFGPDGTAYAISLPFDGNFIRNGMGVAVSHDGGRTWTGQQDIDPLIARPDTLDPSDDKEAVTADPNRVGVAYGVWDRIEDIFPPCPATPMAGRAAAVVSHDRQSAVRRAAATAADPAPAPCPGLFTGPAFFTRTTDGGRTWEKARVIVPTGPNEQTIDNQVLVNHRTGVLYDFFTFIRADGTNHIEFVSSSDHGTTWSAPVYVQRLFTTAEKRTAPGQCACGVVDPRDPTKPLRTGDIVPSFAIDPNSGQLYVVWQDGRPNSFQNDMLLISTSTRGGAAGTWSDPKLVNPPTDRAAFTTGINVDSRGRVGLIYYDLTPPLSANPNVLLTDTWFTRTSGPGLDFGPRHLIGGPYNMEAAPIARGFFVGDYMSVAPTRVRGEREAAPLHDGEGGRSRFVPIFVMTNCADTSCTAQGTTDGSPKGPDSTDAFTRGSPDDD